MLPVAKLLENLSLVKDEKIKNSGVLIFSKDITKFFLQATINCVFFRGKERHTILDREEYSSDININYEKAFNFVQSKLNTEYIIKGGPRQEVLELPEDALREAILNAIVHRDYSIKGANIQINIYSDRVEIISPGGLVKGMTIKDLGKKSLTRNNLLFGLMQRMDLVEKSGTGYLRIKKALKKYKMPDPIIETNEHWFTITFKRPDLQKMTIRERLESETVQKTTQKTTQKILDLLKENPYLGRKEIAEKLGSISESGVKYNLDKLKKNGTIKRIGPDKGGYWEIITK
jgi:ATP-dependent DNA helicase RecG